MGRSHSAAVSPSLMMRKERLSPDLANRVRVGMWKLGMLKVATVRELLGEYLGNDTTVRKVRQSDGKRRHNLFVELSRWATTSRISSGTLKK